MKAFLDTHAAVFLYAGRISVFGPKSRDLFERCALFVSPVARLELAMLFEIGRIKEGPDSILGALEAELGLALSKDPVAEVVAMSLDLLWTRDPIDRLLVATAMLHQAPLISRDRRILENYADAVW